MQKEEIKNANCNTRRGYGFLEETNFMQNTRITSIESIKMRLE